MKSNLGYAYRVTQQGTLFDGTSRKKILRNTVAHTNDHIGETLVKTAVLGVYGKIRQKI